MFSGWIKYFANGAGYSGADTDKEASWRNSGLDNMKGAAVVDVPGEIGIEGLGAYWQSDDFTVPVRTSGTFAGKKIVRRIQKQIGLLDLFMNVEESNKKLKLSFSSTRPNATPSATLVPNEWQGQWLIAEMDLQSNTLSWYISKDRI